MPTAKTIMDFTEIDCTISHNGRQFTAGGAFVAGDRILCYAKRPTADCISEEATVARYSRWTFTDWHGNEIGSGYATSTWRVGPYGTRMYSFLVRLPDGRTYNCRGQGHGMMATGKLARHCVKR